MKKVPKSPKANKLALQTLHLKISIHDAQTVFALGLSFLIFAKILCFFISSLLFFLYTHKYMLVLTDAQLVAKTLENPDNYALIIDRFEESILRYVGRMTGASHEEIEELGQIIFIKAYRSLNGFDIRLKLSSWLYRIAHNVCVDYLRKSSKKHTVSIDAEDETSQALIEKIATSENISLHISHEAQKQGVHEIIALLPEKYRVVLLLFFMEDKSYEEISDILQIPVSTVGTLLNRAKKHFLVLASEPQFSHLFTYA